ERAGESIDLVGRGAAEVEAGAAEGQGIGAGEIQSLGEEGAVRANAAGTAGCDAGKGRALRQLLPERLGRPLDLHLEIPQLRRSVAHQLRPPWLFWNGRSLSEAPVPQGVTERR